MTRSAARAGWLFAQCVVSLFGVICWAFTRRGAPLVLTHAPDVDDDGRDAQMGPLLEAFERRGQRWSEVRWIPLDRTLFQELRRGRRLFVCHAAVLAVARVTNALLRIERDRAQRGVTTLLLRLLAPSGVVLIDESGSGQPWLAAARARRLPVIGIQHGDFRPGDPLYDGKAFPDRRREPVDQLCVWSPWFQHRLLAISPIYDATNTTVTGRLLHARSRERRTPADDSRTDPRLRVLLLPDSEPEHLGPWQPFLQALRQERSVRMRVRRHPGRQDDFSDVDVAPGSLRDALDDADVAVGVHSSALLEAVAANVLVLTLQLGSECERSADIAEAAAATVADPGELSRICRQIAARGTFEKPVTPAYARIWGGAPPDAVAAVLEVLRRAGVLSSGEWGDSSS